MTKEEFIATVAGYIQKYAPQYGILVHSPIIAQACLESGFGASKLSSQYHNYFGLKCGSKWTGKSVNMKTQEEYTKGTKTTIKDNFRVYPDMEQGIKGYFEFIQLDRYKNLKGITDPRKYLETIKADGYATASDYVADNMKIVNQYHLTDYDKKEGYIVKFSSVDNAIDAVIATATAEEGYLEKKSNSQLDSKTANAGKNNYTKYWRDIRPAWQGESWCACFISWCFMVTFGRDLAEKLLKHFPFLYCPTLAAKTNNKTPKKGSLILFWRPAKKRYGHVGLVYKVDSTYVYTIEGNTSGASEVIDNGGGVCRKKYKRANLDSRTKYFMPDYSLAVDKSAPAPVDGLIGSTEIEVKTFGVGASDPQIKVIQMILHRLGYKGENGKDLLIDGNLGDNTAFAIASFQEDKKLEIKSAGTVGKKTWTALINSL